MRLKLVLVFLMALAIGLSAQFSSFRYLSTANLLEDNMELILDPARISLVEGDYLYTALFNPYAVDGFMSGGVTPAFFLGGKKDFGSFDLGMFALQDENWSEDTAIGEQNTLQDLDNEGTYDVNTYDWETQRDYSYYMDKEYIAIAGFAIPDLANVGIYYQYNTMDSDNISSDTTETITTDLLTGDITQHDNSMSYSMSDMDYTYNIIGFGLITLLAEDLAIGARTGFILGKSFVDYENRGVFFTDLSPNDATDNETENYGRYYGEYDVDNYYDNLGIAYSLFLDEKTENNEYRVQFEGMYSKMSKDDSLSEIYYIEENIVTQTLATGTMLDYEYRNYTSTANLGFVGSENNFGFGMDWYHFFEGNVTFGMGIRYSWDMISRQNIESVTMLDSIYYENGDGMRDANDSIAVMTGNYTVQNDYTYYERSFSMPVAIEFPVFKENLLVRLGANYSCTYIDEQDIYIMTELEPSKWEIVYGDGSTEERFVSTNQTYDPFQTDISYSKDISLTYSYGLGWKVSDNLTIDMMNFYNLTNLSVWNLSATLKF